jgi:hypothetical protein
MRYGIPFDIYLLKNCLLKLKFVLRTSISRTIFACNTCSAVYSYCLIEKKKDLFLIFCIEILCISGATDTWKEDIFCGRSIRVMFFSNLKIVTYTFLFILLNGFQ